MGGRHPAHFKQYAGLEASVAPVVHHVAHIPSLAVCGHDSLFAFSVGIGLLSGHIMRKGGCLDSIQTIKGE